MKNKQFIVYPICLSDMRNLLNKYYFIIHSFISHKNNSFIVYSHTILQVLGTQFSYKYDEILS